MTLPRWSLLRPDPYHPLKAVPGKEPAVGWISKAMEARADKQEIEIAKQEAAQEIADRKAAENSKK